MAGHPRGYVPHYPFGTIQDGFSKKWGIPLEAAMGGKETLYPEYEAKLRKLIEAQAAASGRTSAK